MRIPNRSRLQELLHLTEIQADEVHSWMCVYNQMIDMLEEIPEATQKWINRCYNRPSDDEIILSCIAAIISNNSSYYLELCYPEEQDSWKSYKHGPTYVGFDMGDVYAITLICNTETGDFTLQSWANLLETLL
jgi:hypothetical protein